MFFRFLSSSFDSLARDTTKKCTAKSNQRWTHASEHAQTRPLNHFFFIIIQILHILQDGRHPNNLLQLVVAVVNGVVAKPTRWFAVSYTE